jgi:uncharacterized protein (TIGR03382 family)
LLLPLAAFGQTSELQPFIIQVSGVSDVVLYPETCGSTLTGKWLSQVTQTSCDPMKLWATTGECGDTPGTADVRFNDVPITSLALGSGDFSIRVSTLPGFKDAATPCGGAGFELTHKICGALSVASGIDCTFSTSRSSVRATPANLIYDALPPPTPTLDGVSELDQALQIYFTAASEVVAIEVWIRADGETDWTYVGDTGATSRSSRIEDLINGVLYEVALYSLDASGNASEASNVLTGTPRLTQGFWSAYQSAGGGDQGCGSSATGFAVPIIWLALLALGARRKR